MAVWTTQEIEYLETHASDGAEAIAFALNRSVQSVKHQASRYGFSLRRRWQCTHCGHVTFTPLSQSTGFCSACTKKLQAFETARQIKQMEDDAARDLAATRERQKLYNRKSTAKKNLAATKKRRPAAN